MEKCFIYPQLFELHSSSSPVLIQTSSSSPVDHSQQTDALQPNTQNFSLNSGADVSIDTKYWLKKTENIFPDGLAISFAV